MKRFVTIFLTLALLAGLLAIPAGAANTALNTAAKKAAAFAVSELNMAQRAQIVQGIVLCDNQVGAESRRNRTRHIAESGKLRGVLCRGVERKRVGNAGILVEIEQLPPEIVLRDPWAADVVSEDDRNAVCQCRLRALDDAFKDDVARKGGCWILCMQSS